MGEPDPPVTETVAVPFWSPVQVTAVEVAVAAKLQAAGVDKVQGGVNVRFAVVLKLLTVNAVLT